MTPEALDACLSALSHQTRREIISHLSRGEANLSHVAEDLPISFNTVSKHVRVLEEANLIRRDIRGRDHVLCLRRENLRAVEAWISKATCEWTNRLAAIERHLDEKSKRR